MPGKTISTKTKIAINDKLRELLVSVSDGKWKYKNGEADLDIAKTFGVSKQTVERVRMEMFGPLEGKPPHGFVSNKNLEQHRLMIAALEVKIYDIRMRLEALELVCRNNGILPKDIP